MKQFLTVIFFLLLSSTIFSQQNDKKNLVIITLDGMRWQEIFTGVDPNIIANKNFTSDSEQIIDNFWSKKVTERRKKLFPFLWNTIAGEGQLYGDRTQGGNVTVANKYWFSYPGYNEIFTGFPDKRVNSNDKILNDNENVLEFINKQPGYEGKVAVFTTWDCFPYILNEPRSGMYINSDVDSLNFDNNDLRLINDMQFLTTRPIGVRPDIFTYFAAREYLKAYKPKVLYIAFDETDDYAHRGQYDQYIKSAHAEDAMIKDLWNMLQSMPDYKNNTTLIITCDHGRGVNEEWTSHGDKIKGANETWIAVIGADCKPRGEVKNSKPFHQGQLAATIAALLGLEFKPAHPVMPLIETIFEK